MKKILVAFFVLLAVVFSYYYIRHENLMSAGFESTDSTISHDLFLKEEINVSMVKLISRPKDYDGKLVRVVGVGQVGFEANGLYLSSDDYKHHITKNALSLAFKDGVAELDSLQVLNGQFVRVEGIFDADAGPFGLYSGTIRDVRIYKISIF